jgi:hypothetical protein
MVLEAGYPNTTGFRKVVKVTGITRPSYGLPTRAHSDVHRVLVKKKPDISDADFITHYNEKHAQAAASVLLKHKIIHYSLVCWSS